MLLFVGRLCVQGFNYGPQILHSHDMIYFFPFLCSLKKKVLALLFVGLLCPRGLMTLLRPCLDITSFTYFTSYFFIYTHREKKDCSCSPASRASHGQSPSQTLHIHHNNMPEIKVVPLTFTPRNHLLFYIFSSICITLPAAFNFLTLLEKKL